MKKIFSLLPLCLCIFTFAGSAQLINPGEAAKTAATNKTNSDIQSGANNAADKAEAGIKGLFKKKKKTEDTPAPQTAQTTAVSTTAQNNNSNSTGSSSGPGPSLETYANYDFIQGDRIIFEDNFADDQDGEFPAHWDLGAGQAILNMLGPDKVLKLTDGNYAHVKPLMKSKQYLTDTFSMEFDLYPLEASYPPHIYFYDTDGSSSDLGSVVPDRTSVQFKDNADSKELHADITGDLYNNWINHWHHIAIAYRNKQMKIYIDQYRLMVIPNTGFVPRAFDIEAIGDRTNPIIIKSMRIANGGGMNQIGKKFTDTKLVTHGINFDVDKSTIKPESMGTLNMVAGILKDNPDIKFEIDGHTDATGVAAHNLTLSQQRAESVKAALIDLGVDGARLTTKGFGSSKPVSDNTSMEGKANNRRVEFVKQ